MTALSENPTGVHIRVVDHDPLRARREARELLAEVGDADPAARLEVSQPQKATEGTDKGGITAETVGVMLNAGALVAATVQVWLARVPQRTIVVRRLDGATMEITGRQARADDQGIERFLAGGGDGDAARPEGDGTSGQTGG
ncbi:effector-associated constant component EACC1 [Streptomyces lichenis]|uniref:Uncharacterized protein n=1 Tax=Streptomyces lichenis TaxID=2306967 RepID=A0ABT0I3Y7_9ACTN|nr:hypothetical protein [Streptomyces lichenis]MCK8676036.1 hypothetical protein [Streptomyces lichenis]